MTATDTQLTAMLVSAPFLLRSQLRTATGYFWWLRLHIMPRAVLLDTCIAIRTSGSTLLKVNTLSKLATSDTGLGQATSAFGPRGLPHCWANISEGSGRIAFVFTPAGQAEAFFLEITKTNAMAPTDPAFWLPFGMALVGPPLKVAMDQRG